MRRRVESNGNSCETELATVGEALRLVCGMAAAFANSSCPRRVTLRQTAKGWSYEIEDPIRGNPRHTMMAFSAGQMVADAILLDGPSMDGLTVEARMFIRATAESLERRSAEILGLAQKLLATGELGAAEVEKMMLEDEGRAVAKQAAKM